VLELLRFSLLFFLIFLLLLERTGFFWKIRLVLGERLAMCGGWLRCLLAGLVIKQLSTPAVYGGECWQRAGRVEGVLSECHDMELSPF
jgi:hypothetical protein